MIPWSRKLLAMSFVTVALASGALSIANLAPVPGPAGPLHWVSLDPAVKGDVDGDLVQNSTGDMWSVIIRAVSSEEPFCKYRVSLLRNGEVILDRGALFPGDIYPIPPDFAEVGDLRLYGVDSVHPGDPDDPPAPPYCNGLLNEGDAFRLANVDLGTTYVIRIIWAESGEVAGEVTIET